jgi:hypothetical protein
MSLGEYLVDESVGALVIGQLEETSEAHLDLAKAAKKILSAMYQPVTGAFKRELIVRLFGDEWQPRLILGELHHIRTPQGASNYVERIASFYVGEIESHEVAENAPAPGKGITQNPATESKESTELGNASPDD